MGFMSDGPAAIWGQSSPFAVTKRDTVCGSWSVLIPSTTKSPLSLCLSYARLMLGISAMHGAHHVAQKSISTTLPRNSDNLTLSPARVVPSKSGASSPGLMIWKRYTLSSSGLLFAATKLISLTREISWGPGPQPGAVRRAHRSALSSKLPSCKPAISNLPKWSVTVPTRMPSLRMVLIETSGRNSFFGPRMIPASL